MIPFNKASIVGNELDYIGSAVESGIISGEGTYTERCETALSELLGVGREVLLTPSCTHALEMCALLLELEDGDEIIMPSFTFVSTATAFALRGATPVFADVDPATLNITPESIEASLSDRTRAIVVVHYGGVACEMDRILEIAQLRNIPVIEDAAHALCAHYNGKPLGSLGALATFSFHETKNITCGEGGALVINDPKYSDRSHILRDKGTNRRAFQRGDADFYTWVDIGSSYVMSDVLAAFLWGQLEHVEKITARRKEIHDLYSKKLAHLKDRGVLDYPSYAQPEESSAHLFFILLESKDVRDKLRQHLLKEEIHAVFHYQPLHQSPYVTERWETQPSLPVSEDLPHRLLRLPMYYSLTNEDAEKVISLIDQFFC